MSSVAAATTEAPVDAGAILADLGLPGGDDGESVSETTGGTGGSAETSGTPGGGKGEEQPSAEQAPAATAADAGQPSKRAAFDALFTDEALAKPEGVKAAAAALRERQVKHHETYARTVRRERDAKALAAEAAAAKQNYSQLTGQVHTTLETLFRGSSEDALRELGRLRGKDGIAAYEEMTDAVIAMKRKAEKESSPEAKAALEEVRQLRQSIEHGKITAENNAWRTDVARTAAAVQNNGAPLFPGIANFISSGNTTLREVVQAIEYEFVQNGIQPRASLERLDKIWRAHIPSAPTALPSGNLPGRGVPPARAAGSAAERELSEEERMQEIANDPEVWRQLGLG